MTQTSRDYYLELVTQLEHDLITIEDWLPLVERAKHIMAGLDTLAFFQDRNSINVQVKSIEVIQKIGYHNVDAGGIPEIVNWCLQSWLKVLQSHPERVEVLRGIGSWWLYKAQPPLSRVSDGSSSTSSGGSRSRPNSSSDPTNASTLEPDRLLTTTSSDSDARLHTADYVEARATLQPAVEFLERAVVAADSSTASPRGSLLITAAEAHMSLGNVSYPRNNEDHFRQAVRYLRRAASVPGLPLPPHLQRYLDEYGRFVD